MIPRLRADRFVGADAAGERQAVHLRHMDIHADDVVGGGGDFLQGETAVFRHLRRIPQLRQHMRRYLPVYWIIFNDKNAQRDCFRQQLAVEHAGPPRPRHDGLTSGERDGKVEGAAFADRAFHIDLAAHQPDQHLADRQARVRCRRIGV
jgi:hypothetical protein